MFGFNKKKDDPTADLRRRIEGQPYRLPEATAATAQQEPSVQPAAAPRPAAPRGSRKKVIDEIWNETHPEDQGKTGANSPLEGSMPAPGGNGKKNGNGHQQGADSPLSGTVPVVPQGSVPPQAARSTKDDLTAELEHQKLLQEIEAEGKIPGNGWLFNIKDKHLPEATVLDRGEVLAFALGNMQENMLDVNRKESLFAMFAKDVMRMNVSVKGLSREQGLMARQQDADKAATLNTAKDLMGRPGAV